MDYSIRRYTPELRDQVIELLTHLWSSRLEVNDRGFGWKYERNPYVVEPIMYVALQRGRVVAMRGAYGARWIAGRDALPIGALGVGDMVTHPEHRSRGLYRRIDQTMTSDLGRTGWDYLFNTSPSLAARRTLMKAGWSATPFIRPLEIEYEDRAGGLQRGVRRVVAALTSRLRRTEEPAGARPLVDLQARAAGGVLERADDYVVSLSEEPRVEVFAALAAKNAALNTFRHARDAQYFAWRFGNPLCRYLYVHHESKERQDGFAVLQAHCDRHDAAANLIEWEAADPAVLERMLRAVTRAIPGVAVSIWPDASFEGFEAATAAAGFAPVPDPPPQWTLPSFVLRSIAAPSQRDPWSVGGKSPLALENWSLRMAASDYY